MEISKILIVIIVFMVGFCQVQGSGQMSVRLVLYDNPEGKGYNGHCCDGRYIFCERRGGCDHYFFMCVDRYTSPSNLVRDISNCDFGGVRTGVISDKAYIVFGTYIGGTRNPFQFSFDEWPVEGVKIKANVYDYDGGNSDDFVDYVQTIYIPTPFRSQAIAQPEVINLIHRTTLALMVWCDANFYGPKCDTHCESADDDERGHYTCNVYDGAKICGPGWGGNDCKTNVDECESNPCQNQAMCADEINSYRCLCMHGTSGYHCEIVDDECFSQPCLNGGACMGNLDGSSYLCNCRNNFTGDHCESELSPCDHSPCLNGGICLGLINGSVACECQAGWYGQQCNDTKSVDNICLNGGTCITLDDRCLCRCPDGFSGPLCHNVSACAPHPCMNNATCMETTPGEFQCICAENSYGPLCEFNIEEMTTLYFDDDVTNEYTKSRDVTDGQDGTTSSEKLKLTLYPTPEWSAIILKGKLNKNDSNLIKENLKQAVINSTKKSDIAMTVTVENCNDGQSTFTIYYFKVFLQKKEISPEQIRMILKAMDSEVYEGLFPLPVYWGDNPDESPCGNPVPKPVTQRGMSRLDLWVIVACVVGGLGLVSIVVAVALRRRRRNKYGVKQETGPVKSAAPQRESGLRTSNASTDLSPPLLITSGDGYLYNNAIYESVDYEQMADRDNQPIVRESCDTEPSYDVPPRQENAYADAPPDQRESNEYDVPPNHSHYSMVRESRDDTAVKEVESLYDIPK